jgi:hypothetical protein
MGRPRKKVDALRVIELASKGSTVKEIAALCDVHEATLYRRFAKQIDRGMALRDSCLRAKQYEVAMEGNPALLVWLGKQYLDQSDKNAATNIQVNLLQLSESDRKDAISIASKLLEA